MKLNKYKSIDDVIKMKEETAKSEEVAATYMKKISGRENKR
jgi:hypothetical protein